MGPATASFVPSLPMFSWDTKSAPCTDGKDDQEDYHNSVKLWQAFHDSLSEKNSNKIPSNLRAICLKSQLYRRAKDLCSVISDEELLGDDGVQLISESIYHLDALSVLSKSNTAFFIL